MGRQFGEVTGDLSVYMLLVVPQYLILNLSQAYESECEHAS